MEYTYDKNGNLTKDLNKNISSIGYNFLNLPNQVIFAGGNSVLYEYAADGTKLRTVHKTGATTLTTDYCGNAIYENGVLKMLLNDAGYVSFPDRKVHFYLKDHQGNTRVVADKDGNVEETNAYYPFGGTFTSTNNVQPFKYNGKELDQKNGLNWYDYGARHYDAAIGRWHVVDPMSEKYYSSSLFAYCTNNPMRYVDYKGDSISLAGLQQLDKQFNSNYTQTIVNDLQSQTGLTITVAANGSMSYAKDANGNPIIVTTTDTNGSTVQIGSATARKLITESIKHSDWVSVISGKSGVVPGTNDIGLNYKQIDGFINGTVGLDNKTLGWGMTFMHELHHTQVGGGLRDIPGNPGPVVSQMNIIRSELNTLGGKYGQRLDYMATPVGAYNYIPFNKPSQSLLSVGLAPISMYVKFK